MAGTAYGLISTDTSSLEDPPPPNGTIFERLSHHHVSWRNYFSDLPATGIIPSTIEKYPSHITHISQFFTDPAIALEDAFVAGSENGASERSEHVNLGSDRAGRRSRRHPRSRPVCGTARAHPVRRGAVIGSWPAPVNASVMNKR